MTVTYHCPECEKPHEFNVTFGYPPVYTHNHDDPRFCDPGMDDDVDGPSDCDCGYEFTKLDDENILQQAADEVRDRMND